MSLRVDIDISDSAITEKAFSLVDSALRERDAADFTLLNLWPIPGSRGVTLLPDQIRTDWGVTQVVRKWGLSDWLIQAGRWEQIARRAPNDWFLASKGLASATSSTGVPTGVALPLTSVAALPENAGLYVELFGYGVPGTRVVDLLQVSFAGGLIFHIHSDGRADLEDRRPGSAAYGTYLTKGQSLSASSGFAAGGLRPAQTAGRPATDLLGKTMGIALLPYRRGRLLVYTTQGGLFEVYIGGRADASEYYSSRRSPNQSVYFLTTGAGAVTVTASPAARSLFAVNPLSCAQATTGTLTSPLLTLPYDVATGPSGIFGETDQQDGTSLSLSGANPDGSAFAPTSTQRAQYLRYQVGFSGGSASTSFPFFYALEMRWDRAQGQRYYNTSTVPTTHTVSGNVIKASVSFSRDRGQKSCEVVIDNPQQYYTSLKDLWNRPILVSFDSRADDSAFGLPPGNLMPVFMGMTDPAGFEDGTASTITVRASGLRKKLKSELLNDSMKFDGMLDTDVVRKILRDAGVPDAQMVVYDPGGTPLSSADPGDDPLWQPANGTSADEFLQSLADTWSGWVWDDIGGVYYYVPREYFTLTALANHGGTVPLVYQGLPLGYDQKAGRTVNSPVLLALAGSVKQTAEEPRANEFWVLGQDSDGKVVSAHYEDWGSINDRTAPNWVGERRTLIYASGSITDLQTAQIVMGALVPAFSQAVVSVEFALPDYQLTQIPLDGPVQLQGFGVGLITALSADLTNDRNRRTEYTYEVLQ